MVSTGSSRRRFLSLLTRMVGLTVFAIATDVQMTRPEQAAAHFSSPPAEAAGGAPGQVYGANCLSCHDADGRGKTKHKAMPALPDLADVEWQAAHSAAELEQAILNGKGKFMQPMKDKLSPAEARQLVAFLRGF